MIDNINDVENNMVNIQYQNQTGNWTTVMTVYNESINITNAMTQTQNSYNARVRAVDMSGKLVDIL